MAGNVTPQLTAINAKKEADPEWKTGYGRIIRVMTNALSPTRGPVADHVYYDPHRSGNTARTQDLSKLRQVRVEVASAIEFLWYVYGVSDPPEGLQIIHQRLHSKDAHLATQTVVEETKESKVSEAQPPSTKSTAHRDQRVANATKEIKRLGALIYILTHDLFGFSRDTESPPPTLRDDVLGSIKAAAMGGREGFGPDGVQTLLDKSFRHFFQLKG